MQNPRSSVSQLTPVLTDRYLTSCSVRMRQDSRPEDVDSSRVRQNQPVKQHALPSDRNIALMVIEGDESLQLQACCEGCRGSEHQLAPNRYPSGEPSRCGPV